MINNQFHPSPHIALQSLSFVLKKNNLLQELKEDHYDFKEQESGSNQTKSFIQKSSIPIYSNVGNKAIQAQKQTIHTIKKDNASQDNQLQTLPKNHSISLLPKPLSSFINNQKSLSFQYSSTLSKLRHQTNIFQSKRKNSCFKKKTLTFKQSQVNKKVFFDSENNQKQNEHQIVHNLSKNDKKNGSNDSKCSTTSICLQYKEFNKTGLGKSSSGNITIHDLGENHLIYRIKSSYRGQRQKALFKFQANSQEEIRQFSIFQIMKNLKHQNIITLHQMTKEFSPNNNGTIINLKIDFYPSNLKQYLQSLLQSEYSTQRIRLQRKIILFKIIKGLNFLHKNKICHRNITPSNILLNSKLQVVISNFSSILTEYMPTQSFYKCQWLIRPPQVILQPDFRNRQAGDLWGLGCLIVFMLKHKMPFEEYSDSNLILQMIRTIGNFSQEDLKYINFKDTNKFIFPKMRKESMSKNFNCQQQDLLDILKKMFIFNPLKRQNTLNLLKSSYFDQLRQKEFYHLYQCKYFLHDLFQFSQIQFSTLDKKLIVPQWYKLS